MSSWCLTVQQVIIQVLACSQKLIHTQISNMGWIPNVQFTHGSSLPRVLPLTGNGSLLLWTNLDCVWMQWWKIGICYESEVLPTVCLRKKTQLKMLKELTLILDIYVSHVESSFENKLFLATIINENDYTFKTSHFKTFFDCRACLAWNLLSRKHASKKY